MDLILYDIFSDGTVLSINVLSICNDSQISDRYYFNCSVVALATSFALVYFIMCGRSETIIYFFIALKIIGDSILKKISYDLKSVLV